MQQSTISKIPVTTKLAKVVKDTTKKQTLKKGQVSVVDYRNIIKNNEKIKMQQDYDDAAAAAMKKGRNVGGIVELQGAIKGLQVDDDFVDDDPDVPPLC